ncbi:GAF domain-containing protein [Olivibacter domesticus]|uniref:PAS fold-containing protein n=1 Tax=Olivibacter domesticus TaxID=407022 RepID=A0A1H7KGK7_OLID1|nr:GAF domain-containing protein [Olivibacter domesticus]SEK86033.1 PAS fold-containing protein [Olivibacter domesticus]
MIVKNYDAEFCGKIPIHHINLIQPHGYLLVLDRNDQRIVQLSENIQSLFGKTPEEIIGTNFSEWIAEPLDLTKLSTNANSHQKTPYYLTIYEQRCLALVQAKEKYLIVELTAASGDRRDFLEIYQTLTYYFSVIEEANDLPSLLKATVEQIRLVSGFDRVMIYQFDENWNGKVIAEVNHTGKTDYLGQQFPPSDIPKTARDLYQRNPYRLIPTSRYEPVKLYPIVNPITLSFMDLSDCHLRSVPKVHLEYLQNMGVDASMSVRILIDNRLWGLISFHHNTPKYPDFELCSQLQLLAEFFTRQLANLLNKEHFDLSREISMHKNALLNDLYEKESLEEALLNQQEHLLKLFACDGAALIFQNKLHLLGKVPDDEHIQNFVFWLQEKNVDRVFAVNNLSDLFEEAKAFASVASGMLVIEIDKDHGNYLICFRPEHPYTINWGGNPNEALQFESDKKNYHPRNSFVIWRQQIQHTSLAWKNEELLAASDLRHYLFEHLRRHPLD